MEKYKVLSVVLLNKKKYKILLEGTSNFYIALYPSEVRRFDIKEESYLNEEHYREIKEILYKRGKERALYYLKDSDKTSSQMRTKLKEGFYPEEIINKVMDFLLKYGYVDDYQYAIRYISYNMNRKSYLKIKESLYIKGIEKNIIDEAFSNLEEDNICGYNNNQQLEIIRRLINKKITIDMDKKLENKIITSLMRKGFVYEDIVNVLQEEKNTIFSV